MERSEFEAKVRHSLIRGCGVAFGDQLLVALSGGADSVALLRVMLSMGVKCIAAHCNFHLRGEESMRDERFVRHLCQSLDVKLHVKDFDVESYRKEHGVSVEMACRELRYAWFNELLESDNCDFVAVAHHGDDNIETMFLNMLRGTGIAGLTGMKPRSGVVVRPLLCVSRSDVQEYLGQIGQDYVTDSTNLQNDYQRNKVRNVILHNVDTLFADGRARIGDTMRNLGEFESLYKELVDGVVQQCRMSRPDEEKQVYSLLPLRRYSQPKLLLQALLSPYGFNISQCEQMVAKIIDDNVAEKSHFYTSTSTATLDNKEIVIEKIELCNNAEYSVRFDDVSRLPVKLEVKECEMPFDASEIDGKSVVAFDSSVQACKRVVLRHWRVGDRIRPFGMNGTRLVSDIFTDAHLTLEEKKRQWLLEADGEILWILGFRASAEYRVTPASTSHITLRFEP